MKWFKHFSSNSTLNRKLTQIIDEGGMDGYGRYFVLVEHLVLSADDMTSAPKVTLSLKRWAEILHLKSKTVKPFLEYLQNILVLNVEVEGNVATVELRNHTEILSNRAISSQSRGPARASRPEKNITYPNLKLNRQDARTRQDDLAGNPVLLAAAQSSPDAAKALQTILEKQRESS